MTAEAGELGSIFEASHTTPSRSIRSEPHDRPFVASRRQAHCRHVQYRHGAIGGPIGIRVRDYARAKRAAGTCVAKHNARRRIGQQHAAQELDRRKRRADHCQPGAIDRVHRARSLASLAPRHAEPRDLSGARTRAIGRRSSCFSGQRRRLLRRALRRDALLDRRPPVDGKRAWGCRYGDALGDTTALPPYLNWFAGGPSTVRGYRGLGPKDSLGNPYGGNLLVSAQLELKTAWPHRGPTECAPAFSWTSATSTRRMAPNSSTPSDSPLITASAHPSCEPP